jgi:hypothetical protein
VGSKVSLKSPVQLNKVGLENQLKATKFNDIAAGTNQDIEIKEIGQSFVRAFRLKPKKGKYLSSRSLTTKVQWYTLKKCR